MRRAGNSTIDLGVFGISVVITVLFVLWGVLATDNLAAVTGAILDFVISNFGWVFILSSFGFLVFSVYPEPRRALTRPTGAPAPQQARAVDPESRS